MVAPNQFVSQFPSWGAKIGAGGMAVQIGYLGHVDAGVLLYLFGITAFLASGPENFPPIWIEMRFEAIE